MDIQYLVRLEEKMENELLRLCTERGALKGTLLATEDIDEQWKILAPEYMADAVPEIANYPTVSVSWAAYLGLAIAYGWDADWETFIKMPYQSYYGEQGFDDLDEHIVRDLLRIPLDSRHFLLFIFPCLLEWKTNVFYVQRSLDRTAWEYHSFWKKAS